MSSSTVSTVGASTSDLSTSSSTSTISSASSSSSATPPKSAIPTLPFTSLWRDPRSSQRSYQTPEDCKLFIKDLILYNVPQDDPAVERVCEILLKVLDYLIKKYNFTQSTPTIGGAISSINPNSSTQSTSSTKPQTETVKTILDTLADLAYCLLSMLPKDWWLEQNNGVQTTNIERLLSLVTDSNLLNYLNIRNRTTPEAKKAKEILYNSDKINFLKNKARDEKLDLRNTEISPDTILPTNETTWKIAPPSMEESMEKLKRSLSNKETGFIVQIYNEEREKRENPYTFLTELALLCLGHDKNGRPIWQLKIELSREYKAIRFSSKTAPDTTPEERMQNGRTLVTELLHAVPQGSVCFSCGIYARTFTIYATSFPIMILYALQAIIPQIEEVGSQKIPESTKKTFTKFLEYFNQERKPIGSGYANLHYTPKMATVTYYPPNTSLLINLQQSSDGLTITAEATSNAYLLFQTIQQNAQTNSLHIIKTADEKLSITTSLESWWYLANALVRIANIPAEPIYKTIRDLCSALKEQKNPNESRNISDLTHQFSTSLHLPYEYIVEIARDLCTALGHRTPIIHRSYRQPRENEAIPFSSLHTIKDRFLKATPNSQYDALIRYCEPYSNLLPNISNFSQLITGTTNSANSSSSAVTEKEARAYNMAILFGICWPHLLANIKNNTPIQNLYLQLALPYFQLCRGDLSPTIQNCCQKASEPKGINIELTQAIEIFMAIVKLAYTAPLFLTILSEQATESFKSIFTQYLIHPLSENLLTTENNTTEYPFITHAHLAIQTSDAQDNAVIITLECKAAALNKAIERFGNMVQLYHVRLKKNDPTTAELIFVTEKTNCNNTLDAIICQSKIQSACGIKNALSGTAKENIGDIRKTLFGNSSLSISATASNPTTPTLSS